MEAQKAYGDLLEKRTKDVINFLDISPENWQVNFQEAMNDPVAKAKMQADEATLKIALDTRELTESKGEIKAIWLEMLKMQGDL